MNAFLAIIGDTWRQSRQQVVFLVFAVIMLLAALTPVALMTSRTASDGSRYTTWRWSEDSLKLDQAWASVAANSIVGHEQQRLYREYRESDEFRRDSEAGTPKDAFAFHSEAQKAAEREVAETARELTVETKSAQLLAYFYVLAFFTIGMWGFIAASAGYFPGLLAAGAVDVVVAKPIDRTTIYAGKFIGGLVFLAALHLVCCVIAIVGIGIVTGAVPLGMFASLAPTMLSASLLYSFVALIGLWKPSATLALILGLGYYFVVDTALGFVLSLRFIVGIDPDGALSNALEFAEKSIPNFSMLREAAAGSVLSAPYYEPSQLIAATAWLVGAIALGMWRFRRSEF